MKSPRKTRAYEDPEFRRRFDRLARMLDRIRSRTERDAELTVALRESERVGAKRERDRCADWLESLDCSDAWIKLLMREVAGALRKNGLPDDP